MVSGALPYSFKSEFLPEHSTPVFLVKMEARKSQQPSCLSKDERLLQNPEELGSEPDTCVKARHPVHSCEPTSKCGEMRPVAGAF